MKMDQQHPVIPAEGKSIAARPLRFFVPTVFVYTLAVALLLWLLHFAPFYAPGYFFWFGFVFALIGLVTLLRPLRFLLIFNRRIAAIVVGCGFLLSATALLWPAQVHHSTASRQQIDALLPDYTFHEYHETRVHASPEQVMRAAKQIDVFDVPAIRFLMRIRMLAGKALGEATPMSNGKPDPKSHNSFDWDAIKVGPNERLLCLLLPSKSSPPPPLMTSAGQFSAFKDDGYVKVVTNCHVEDLGNGITLLSTETRVQPNDATTLRYFKLYWRIIYPGTAITRRVWLDTIAARAENI